MTQSTEHPAPCVDRTRSIKTHNLVYLALWFSACNFFTIGLSAQPSDWNLHDQTISSGTSVYQALNSVRAYQNFTINGNADVTFIAGSFIDLGIGFHATAVNGARFHATTAPPRTPVGVSPPLPGATLGGVTVYTNDAVGNPLVGAGVSLTGPASLFGTTDATGRFQFINLPLGSTLSISATWQGHTLSPNPVVVILNGDITVLLRWNQVAALWPKTLQQPSCTVAKLDAPILRRMAVTMAPFAWKTCASDDRAVLGNRLLLLANATSFTPQAVNCGL